MFNLLVTAGNGNQFAISVSTTLPIFDDAVNNGIVSDKTSKHQVGRKNTKQGQNLNLNLTKFCKKK